MIVCAVLAKMLFEKHGIKTIIGYLKPWGFSGSYESHLPECPIKDCVYNFESQTLESKDITNKSPQTPTNTKEIDKELISTIYKQIIPEIENQIFSIKDTKSTKTRIPKPKLDLAQFSSKISKTEFREIFIKVLRNIVSDLFLTENSDKTFEDFRECGLKRFEKCMKKIHKLLIEINHSHICEEICEYLKKNSFHGGL